MRLNRLNRFALIASTAAGLLLGLALAGPVQAQANKKPCDDDVRRLCINDVPDVEKIATCMCLNIDSVSPGCRATMKRVDCEYRRRHRR